MQELGDFAADYDTDERVNNPENYDPTSISRNWNTHYFMCVTGHYHRIPGTNNIHKPVCWV